MACAAVLVHPIPLRRRRRHARQFAADTRHPRSQLGVNQQRAASTLFHHDIGRVHVPVDPAGSMKLEQRLDYIEQNSKGEFPYRSPPRRRTTGIQKLLPFHVNPFEQGAAGNARIDEKALLNVS